MLYLNERKTPEKECINLKLGIIGAMEEEVAQLKEKMTNLTITAKAGMDFYDGLLLGKEVTVVRSGIGKVNAGCCTQILADLFHVDCVINTGIAGSLDAAIDIGDIVLCTDAVQHDMDAVAFGYDLGVIPRMPVSFFPADETLRKTAKELCEQVNPEISVHEGRVATGDQFIADKAKKDFIVNNFHAKCTEMEGAAIAQAAYNNNLPFLIIRAISDKADNSAQMDYPTFEKQAIAHTVKLMLALVEKIA